MWFKLYIYIMYMWFKLYIYIYIYICDSSYIYIMYICIYVIQVIYIYIYYLAPNDILYWYTPITYPVTSQVKPVEGLNDDVMETIADTWLWLEWVVDKKTCKSLYV